MACPFCTTTGWVGGWIGGYFGIDPPKDWRGKLFSALVTANLVSITIIALKSLFNFSFCNAGGFTLENTVRLGLATMVMSILYTIGVNFLLNRYLVPDPSKKASGVSGATP